MGVGVLRARAELRAGWRGWLAALVIVAIGGGVAITVAAAARRTDTAFDRALREGRAADAFVTVDATSVGAAAARKIADRIEADPSVAVRGAIAAVDLEVVHDGRIDARMQQNSATGLVTETPDVGTAVSRMHIVSGRSARPDAADEVVINPPLVARMGWRVGERIADVKLFAAGEMDADGNADPTRGTPVPLRVVGIGFRPEELLVPAIEREHRVYLTQAFAAAHPESAFYYADALRLRHGRTDIEALRKAAQNAVPAGGPFTGVVATAEGADQVHRGSRPLVGALWIVAALAALATLVLATQAIARQLQAGGDDDAVMRAVGATRAERWGVALLPALAVVAAGTVLAAAAAVVASPLTPVGHARAAEPHPGVAFNVAIVLGGAGIVAIVIVLAVLWPAWRIVTRGTRAVGSTAGRSAVRSRLADLIGRSGLPLPAAIGTRMALGRDARSNVSTVGLRTTLVGGVCLTVAVITFGHNVVRLTTTPRLYGWTWDAAAGATFDTVPDEAVDELRHLPYVAAAAGMTFGQISIRGRTIPAAGIDPLEGTVTPAASRGRLPGAEDEIALGATSLHAIHARVGDTVTATVGGEPRVVHIVGTVALPSLGQVRYHETGLGVGALTRAGFFPQEEGSSGRYNDVLFTFERGHRAQAIRGLRAALASAGCAQDDCVITDSRPNDLNGYAEARPLPVILAAMLLVLLLASLVHGILATGRRHRADLSVLQALGFRRRQVAGVLRWQGLTLAVVAVAIGVPLGVALGHWGWLALTHQLGVAVPTAVPLTVLAAVALGVMAASVALAATFITIPTAVLSTRE